MLKLHSMANGALPDEPAAFFIYIKHISDWAEVSEGFQIDVTSQETLFLCSIEVEECR